MSRGKFRGRVLVTGAGVFIGSHMVEYLKERGYWVRGVDVKESPFMDSGADEFWLMDVRNTEGFRRITEAKKLT